MHTKLCVALGVKVGSRRALISGSCTGSLATMVVTPFHIVANEPIAD
jgi:hypothetical protein